MPTYSFSKSISSSLSPSPPFGSTVLLGGVFSAGDVRRGVFAVGHIAGEVFVEGVCTGRVCSGGESALKESVGESLYSFGG